MCLFPTDGRGETTRKLRHDIINSSLSIRLSKSPIDCAFTLELTGESLSKSGQNVVTFERPGEPAYDHVSTGGVCGKADVVPQ